MKNIQNALIAAVAAAALITPAIASAQDVSYADGGNQQIQGTVAAINGVWNISIDDANGYTDSVQLEQGTIINPTGLTLEPGMNVTVDGYADGPNFDALEIDTPYQYQGPAPVAVYYGPGDWYRVMPMAGARRSVCRLTLVPGASYGIRTMSVANTGAP